MNQSFKSENHKDIHPTYYLPYILIMSATFTFDNVETGSLKIHAEEYKAYRRR